jgi:Domain of unknown function (DUF4349)
MRGPDSDSLSPEIATALMAVDATLAGEPVDPEYAELAELALILRRERPRTSDAFTARLDERVERRFARPAPAARGTGLRRWLFGPIAGLAAGVAAIVLVVLVVSSGGGGTNLATSSSASVASPTTAASSSASAGGAAGATGAAGAAASGAGSDFKPDARVGGKVPARAAEPSASAAANGSAASSASAATSSSAAPSPVIPQGRQVVQSAQLQLSAAPSRIDDVAQQVFNVVGQEKGFVNSSNVTSGDSYNSGATFQLSVPSANLSATLTDLSRLRGAHVVSRTDQTNDITAQVGGAGQKLAEARALRRSLLKQLANATTTAQVNSIEARLHDANASIASDLSTLRGLQRQVAYSKISLNIEPTNAPPPVTTTHHSGGFGIGQAAHDAGRVLVVVAGVALIVLAVLVPVALVGALAAWVGFAIRRRRREQALDLV